MNALLQKAGRARCFCCGKPFAGDRSGKKIADESGRRIRDTHLPDSPSWRQQESRLLRPELGTPTCRTARAGGSKSPDCSDPSFDEAQTVRDKRLEIAHVQGNQISSGANRCRSNQGFRLQSARAHGGIEHVSSQRCIFAGDSRNAALQKRPCSLRLTFNQGAGTEFIPNQRTGRRRFAS